MSPYRELVISLPFNLNLCGLCFRSALGSLLAFHLNRDGSIPKACLDPRASLQLRFSVPVSVGCPDRLRRYMLGRCDEAEPTGRSV